MRELRLAAVGIACAAWLAVAFAQQAPPPAGTPPARTPPAGTPPAGTPPASRPPADRPPASGAPEGEAAKPPENEENDTFVPTEELQPDAAVTFPVDI